MRVPVGEAPTSPKGDDLVGPEPRRAATDGPAPVRIDPDPPPQDVAVVGRATQPAMLRSLPTHAPDKLALELPRRRSSARHVVLLIGRRDGERRGRESNP